MSLPFTSVILKSKRYSLRYFGNLIEMKHVTNETRILIRILIFWLYLLPSILLYDIYISFSR